MSDLIKKIKSRGYWEVLIRPNSFKENFIESLPRCKEIIREVQVRFSGWYYPYYNHNRPPTNGIDYIETENEWSFFLESWRYYQSGLFVQYFGMIEDWQDQAGDGRRWNIPENSLDIINTLYTFTEIYEFAARLANKQLLGDECTISIGLNGTKDRQLVTIDPRRHFFSTYICKIDNIPRQESYKTTDLIARSSDLALEHTVWVFQRFNWDHVSIGVLKQDQEKYLKGLL